MNIFVLDIQPRLAAQYQCDKHIVKMVLESAQLLCSPFDPGAAPYKRTHYNHPCAIWTRASENNYIWLISHAWALADEFEYRFKKIHKSRTVINWCALNADLINLPRIPRTPFAQCMPDIYKHTDPVVAYRSYYMGVKSSIALWDKGRDTPNWYKIINDGNSVDIDETLLAS